MARETINLGWDKPLDVEWNFQLKELRREIQLLAPGGKSGALKQAFGSADTVILVAPNVIDITVGSQHRAWPYAAIQEYGGPAFDRIIRPKRAGGVLAFYWMGKLRFFKKVTMHAGQILGSHYVQRGVYNWWAKLTRGMTRKEPVISWASGHYAEGGSRLASKRGTISK
jgi:hypothetical protein